MLVRSQRRAEAKRNGPIKRVNPSEVRARRIILNNGQSVRAVGIYNHFTWEKKKTLAANEFAFHGPSRIFLESKEYFRDMKHFGDL